MQASSVRRIASPFPTQQELQHRALSRAAAADGFVLLKNEGALPLDPAAPLALFGSGAGHTVKGGTGSGDVNSREAVSIRQGLEAAGLTLTSRAWLGDYDARCLRAQQARKEAVLREKGDADDNALFNIIAAHPFRFPDGRAITAEDIGPARTAVYVLSRIAGEAADRQYCPGDYLLTEAEMRDLQALCDLCDSVILLINAGAQIDLQWVRTQPKIRAIVFLAQPGMEGGNAVADVLTGAQNFSGRLTATWPLRYEDLPNADTFSHRNGDVEHEFYHEDLYVGYRYFDTFGVKPAFCFGHGLSYTTFSMSLQTLGTDGPDVLVSVRVKNTGAASGREVVQIYASCPQSSLAKEHRRLCAFAKTRTLDPGEEETVCIRFPMRTLASFSEGASAWILEPGLYGLWIGASLDASVLMAALAQQALFIVERVHPICPQQEPFERLTCAPEALRRSEEDWHAHLRETGCPVLTLQPVTAPVPAPQPCPAAEQARAIVRTLTDAELAALCVGNVAKGQGNAIGSAGVAVPGSAGETTDLLAGTHGVPGIVMADGPAGLRLISEYHVSRETGAVLDGDFLFAFEGGSFAPEVSTENADAYYQYCTAFPVGTLLAQTWDPALLQRIGGAVAGEMQTFGVSWWLAPGMNLQRNPLCGRNFEYFSEDPVVSGVCAAAIVTGVQAVPGMGATIKHFACNNQEDNRMGSDSIVGERALRELYLRAFEIAVKTAQPRCIMTSYNKLNGVHTANSADLCTRLAREEWGFAGIFMTDWTTTSNGSSAWRCVAAGNDLIMPGVDGDTDEILAALQDGRLSRAALMACAERMLQAILQSAAG